MVTFAAKPLTVEEVHHLNALTPRVAWLRQQNLDAPVMMDASRARLLTESWKETEGQPQAVRRARALAKVLQEIPVVIFPGELVVGSPSTYYRGCHPCIEWQHDLLIKELTSERFTAHTEAVECGVSDEDRQTLLECARYWQGKSVASRCEEIFQEKWGTLIRDAEETMLLQVHHRQPLGVPVPDFEKLMAVGLKGVIAEIEGELAATSPIIPEARDKYYLLKAMKIACEAVITYARRHGALAREMAQKESDPGRREELERIAEICEWVPENPPRTFQEALQSFWFVCLADRQETASSGQTPQRIDQYLFPFYEADMREGRISREAATELLACLWTKFAQMISYRDYFTRDLTQGSEFINVTLGGVKPDGADATNELSFLMLEVERQLRYGTPHMSVRVHEGSPEDFLVAAIDCNKAVGGGIPAFFNDGVAIEYLERRGVPLHDARDWVPVGCVGKKVPASASTPSPPWFSLGKILELALFNGVDPRTGKRLGPETGDPRTFATFEEFQEAFKRQAEYVTRLVCESHNIYMSVRAEVSYHPFVSALTRDCIKKGKDWVSGGFRYMSISNKIIPVGHVNTADSLTAIKKLVYEEKSVTWDELLEALGANFEGHEELRQKLLAVPKYGNDDDYADQGMVDLFAYTEALTESIPDALGIPYNISRQGNASHYAYGIKCGALPDGRKAWEPFADGSLSPMRGLDSKGPTAVFNSAAKPPILFSQGTVLNQKIHPTVLRGREQYRKLMALVQGYFQKGGYHVQFNMVSPEVLLDAKRHPEQYRDLVVRVGGYSAFFVELAPEIQDEIIARTTQEVC